MVISGRTVEVDDEDFDLLSAYSWHTFKSTRGPYYVKVRQGSKSLYLHRLIMKAHLTDGLEIDHIDRNGLNNRRSNLRVVTHSQNMLNARLARGASGYVGVSQKGPRSFVAIVTRKPKTYYVGSFPTAQDAHEARLRYIAENLPH